MRDSYDEYRPHESPANKHIKDGAGDAVGILRGSSGKMNAIAFSAVQPHRLEVLNAALKVVVAEEQPLEGQRGLTRWKTLYKWLLYTPSSGQPGLF